MEDREKLIDLFEETAELLELSGANPFKARAYRNAARVLQTNPLPLESFLNDPPKGFGESICNHIKEFLKTGTIAEVQRLRSSFPKGLAEILRIPGLGPKKTRILYEKLHIDDIEKLEKACKNGSIAQLQGFGEKSVINILDGINLLHRFSGSFLSATAMETAENILEIMRSAAPEAEYHIAGSLRRFREIVKDIDILAATDGVETVKAAFSSLPNIIKVIGAGETKISVVLKNGIQADLRIVPPESLGPALCYFTGSKEHNVLMRSRALSKGFTLNEYGLFDEKSESAPPMASEEEVFEALGLPWIAPELREGLDEIELAAEGRLPVLVEAKDILGTLHVHTNFSDGRADFETMANAAVNCGLKWLGISDHSISAHYAHGLDDKRLELQWREIDRWNAERKDVLHVLKGIESDILPNGDLDYSPEILKKFDFVVASVHSNFSMSREEMTNRVVKAVENPFTCILGHPEGRLLLSRKGYDMDLERVLEACVKNCVAVEINAQPQRLDLDWRYVRAWRESGLMFVIAPDAHDASSFNYMRYGLGIARKGGLEADQLLNSLTSGQLIRFFGKAREKRKAA